LGQLPLIPSFLLLRGEAVALVRWAVGRSARFVVHVDERLRQVRPRGGSGRRRREPGVAAVGAGVWQRHPWMMRWPSMDRREEEAC
jgi:hypothetical protein